MLNGKRTITHVLMFTATLAAALLLSPPSALAQQEQTAQQPATQSASSVADVAKPAAATKTASVPVFDDYKGVKIGMSAEEARQLLGDPKEKGKEQDFYAFSDSETAQVFYDGEGKVNAVAVSFYGDKGGAPEPSAVLGMNVEAKPDGSLYRREPYPDAGYWVSYSRTAGDAPLVTITIQKMH